MRKLFKKIATVVAAVSMVAAMTTTAFAAKDPGKLYVVGSMTNWSEFKEMTAAGNGVYTYTFEGLTAGSEVEYKFTLEADWKGEVCSTGADNFKTKVGDDGKLTLTLDFAKLGDATDNNGNPRYTVDDTGALTFTAPAAGGTTTGGDTADKPADKPADTPATGDSTAVVAMAAVAAVAGALVVASRRQTANN